MFNKIPCLYRLNLTVCSPSRRDVSRRFIRSSMISKILILLNRTHIQLFSQVLQLRVCHHLRYVVELRLTIPLETHKVADIFFVYNGYVHWYYARCRDVSFAIPWNKEVCRVREFLCVRASWQCVKDKVYVVDHHPLCHHFRSFDKVHYMLDQFLSGTKSWFSACAR